MIYSANQILEQCNYLISYNYLSSGYQATISPSWNKDSIYSIKWNPKLKAVVSNFNNTIIPCESYAVKSIAKILVNNICQYYKYPITYVKYQTDDTASSEINFNLPNIDVEKSKNLEYIVDDIVHGGLKPEHIAICKDNGIIDGLNDVCKFYLNQNLK